MALSLKALVKRFAREERGASFVEYAMLTGLVAAIVVTAIAIMEPAVEGVFSRLAATLGLITTGTPGVQ